MGKIINKIKYLLLLSVLLASTSSWVEAQIKKPIIVQSKTTKKETPAKKVVPPVVNGTGKADPCKSYDLLKGQPANCKIKESNNAAVANRDEDPFNISSCRQILPDPDSVVNASPVVYTMSGDLVFDENMATRDEHDGFRDCIVIRRSNVTIDCQNHSIHPPIDTTHSGHAISVKGQASNITIRNCNISGLVNGVYIGSSIQGQISIENNQFVGNGRALYYSPLCGDASNCVGYSLRLINNNMSSIRMVGAATEVQAQLFSRYQIRLNAGSGYEVHLDNNTICNSNADGIDYYDIEKLGQVDNFTLTGQNNTFNYFIAHAYHNREWSPITEITLPNTHPCP